MMDIIAIVKKARKYVVEANQEAEARHDNYGDFYMDAGQFAIMEETEALITEIDKCLKEHE